ncbi:Putative UDP-glucuronosyl/UDP-glucosyltransferase [Septoria linicola]|uniref:UDP-glucuronosyl/UDP-glucosyltransferase n=1 Tax=Septoria linicola TaxID=215465 RepID=A0A9Q9AFP1_9PEZI|nr:Putative UDP-glucuronosyl/UDP-glucosyltransferase [Septoria linicola]
MGTLPDARKTHIIIAALPFYGHVRPLRPLAKELAARGYSVTFITGSVNQKQIEAIPGVDFVPLTGRADYHPDRLQEDFPGRPEGMTVLFDIEHIFIGPLHDQFQTVQEVMVGAQANGKDIVLIQDASFVGSMPLLLGSPLALRVPVIGIGHFPLMLLSKDTAPFGSGLQSQGEEINDKMNAGAIQMFSGIQGSLRAALERYNCSRDLPSEFPVDNWILLPDVYCQLCPPALEPQRSSLPKSIRFAGTLIGGNDKKALPEWWHSFVADTNDTRPLIIVTSGSLPGLNVNDLILPTINACTNLPVRLVVCAVHISLPPDLTLPSNTRWAQWIAFEDIFPYTAFVVSSGGYGGISQAFANGIPMILAGTTEDKVETGLRAEATGAAINLKTQTPSVEMVKEAIEKMLEDDEGYKAKADGLKKAYAECDAVGSVIGAVEELTEKFYGRKHDSGISTPAVGGAELESARLSDSRD